MKPFTIKPFDPSPFLDSCFSGDFNKIQNVVIPEDRESTMPGLVLLPPFCAVPGCEYRQCVWAEGPYCFPHSVDHYGEAEMIRRYEATHDITWEEFQKL